MQQKVSLALGVFVLVLWSCNKKPTEATSAHVPSNQVVSGGVARDGIPALNSPRFIDAAQATYLSNAERVVGVAFNGVAKAYPLKIFNWHEIANDNVGGVDVTVTFCPLTGSSLVWSRTIAGSSVQFGVSGLLFRNNLIPFDRSTNSQYSQMYFCGFKGSRANTQLTRLPAMETTWGHWKRLHPETVILSPQTGFSRDYSVNPYGTYETDDRIFFPVTHRDSRFNPKEKTLGFIAGNVKKGYFYSRLFFVPVVNDTVNGTEIVVTYDPSNRSALVLSPLSGGNKYTFTSATLPDGRPGMTDSQTGSQWTLEGLAVSGPLTGNQLTVLPSYSAFWFAWFDFFPETRIF
jgi:hypothetical protein